jgi:hypothetical protein
VIKIPFEPTTRPATRPDAQVESGANSKDIGASPSIPIAPHVRPAAADTAGKDRPHGLESGLDVTLRPRSACGTRQAADQRRRLMG